MELALSAARSDCDRQDRPRAAIYAHGGEPPEPGARMRRADSRVRKRSGAGIKRTLTEGEGFEPSVPVDPGQRFSRRSALGPENWPERRYPSFLSRARDRFAIERGVFATFETPPRARVTKPRVPIATRRGGSWSPTRRTIFGGDGCNGSTPNGLASRLAKTRG